MSVTSGRALGALEEAAIYLARAEDPGQAREEARAVTRDLIDGLLSGSARQPG